jgi:8-oxo-dGTP pyrophosphatase MutT (NUDIX family)
MPNSVYPADALAADGVFRPNVTVAAVVHRDGRFLMVEERSGERLVINQPAGHLEQDESLVDAVVRETREETGWRIEPSGLVAVYRWRHPVTQLVILRFTFAARALDQIPGATLDEPVERAFWASRDELAARPDALRSPMVLRSIDDYLGGRLLPLSALVDVPSD